MTNTVEEIKERQVAALKAYAESLVLKRWYGMLLYAFEEQDVAGVSQLDLQTHWFGGDYDLVTAITGYKAAAGLAIEDNHDTIVINFIKEVLGDQLAELGVEPRRVWVTTGEDDAHWVFMLKPGQELNLNPKRLHR